MALPSQPSLHPARHHGGWADQTRHTLPTVSTITSRCTRSLGAVTATPASSAVVHRALTLFQCSSHTTGMTPRVQQLDHRQSHTRLLNRHCQFQLHASGQPSIPKGWPGWCKVELGAGRVSAATPKGVLATVFKTGSHRHRPRRLFDSSSSSSAMEKMHASSHQQPPRPLHRVAEQNQVMSFLVGQVMRRTGGRVDARVVNEELRRRLDA